MIKRNSGFIIGCVLAAGASFFAADVVMSDQVLLKMPSSEETEQAGTEKQLDPEKTTERIYETDPFTVTASGTIVKGVETELPKQTETEETEETEESTPETDENGTVIGTPETDENGNEIYSAELDENGTVIDHSQENSGSWDGSESGGSGSSDSTWNGGGSGGYDGSGSGGSDAPVIEIQDPGNGSYDYNNGGGSGGGSSSGSDSGAWTPDDVIIWGISSRYIDESELYNYSAGQLRLIRNEIFALNGRIFRSQDLADYFSQKSWYVPTYDPDEFDANMFYYLNDYEEANLQVILNYEAALAGN